MNHAAKIDRIRNLLSFDRSFLDPKQQADCQRPGSPIELAFDDAGTSQGDALPDLRLAGFDEAGRGALAGPVAVGCVQFNWNDICPRGGHFHDAMLENYADLNDSKQVTVRNRQRLYMRIQQEAQCGVGFASAPEIDRLGIVKACSLAARRAYASLGLISVDIGLFDRGLSLGEAASDSIPRTTNITKGDAKSFHIAAASILAKVARDAILCSMDARVVGMYGSAEPDGIAERYGFAEPYGFAEVYDFARHKGYGSAAHIAAIRKHGPSKFHRRTFLTRI